MVKFRSMGRLRGRRGQRDYISDRDHLPLCEIALELAIAFLVGCALGFGVGY
jgi:hypothetical protein